MALFELDQVFGYQDANDIKRLWADGNPPENPGEGEVWLDTSGSKTLLKRYVLGVWETIGDVSADEILEKIKTVDGSGSGLNADLLDGHGSAFYRDASNLNTGTVPLDRVPDILTGKDADTLDGQDGSFYQNASNLNAGTVPLARIPATLTGKDADTLDGQHGSYYRDASNLNAGTVPLARIPATLTGKDADTVDGLHSGSFTRSDADDSFSGTLTSTKTSGVPLKFDNGHSMITVHDGSGNFNIKSGVDEDHTTINSDGGSRIELAENGNITLAVSDVAQGSTFTDNTFIYIWNSGVNIDAPQFRVLQDGTERMKVGADGKIYEGTTKLEDKYLMRSDLIFDQKVSVTLARGSDPATTVLDTTGRGSAQISFGGGGSTGTPLYYITVCQVTIDGVLVCDSTQSPGTTLFYHFDQSIKVVAKAEPVGVKCCISYCAN